MVTKSTGTWKPLGLSIEPSPLEPEGIAEQKQPVYQAYHHQPPTHCPATLQHVQQKFSLVATGNNQNVLKSRCVLCGLWLEVIERRENS